MGARLFVGNLNPQTTRDQLARFFAPAGKAVVVSMPLDRVTGSPEGFAFVELENAEAAERAFAECDGRELEGRRVRLSWARDREPASRPRPSWSDQRAELVDELEAHEVRRTKARKVALIDDYASKRPRKPHRHGKHGSDRRRGQGTHRGID